MAWSGGQVKEVARLLMEFNGADEVCAVTKCNPQDLDDFSRLAFGCTFDEARSVWAARGRAKVRHALMEQALDGDMKAIDMLCRAHMGMGPVESRAKNISQNGNGDVDGDDAVLRLIQGRARANGPQRTAVGE